jgi:tyrosine-protein kinase Etk/Wzc
LYVLPAGKLEGSPHQLFTTDKVRVLLDEVRQQYRRVVIDTAPVLVAGESIVLASAADASLLCTRRDVSREDQVRKACRRLRRAGANLAGGVFSGISLRRYSYQYGYGGYYSGYRRYGYGQRHEPEGESP